MARHRGAKTARRPARANHVLAPYSLRCLFRRRSGPRLRDSRGGHCRHLLRVARAACPERTYATTSRARLGNGGVYSERHPLYAYRPPAAAGHPFASSRLRARGSKAGGLDGGCAGSGSFHLDVWRHLPAASG